MIILHLALLSDWETAKVQGEYRVSTVGATLDDVGFIHASTEEQLEQTFLRFYANAQEDLVVVAIDDERLRAEGTLVKFEDVGNGELFPHIYGAIVPTRVEGATRITVSDFARWLRSAEVDAPVSTFGGAYGAGATRRSVTMTFPQSDIGSASARVWLSDAVETAHSALVRYVGVLEEQSQDLASPAVVAAGTDVHHALDGVGTAHTRYSGGPLPSADDVHPADDSYVDDSESWDEEYGQVDPTAPDQVPSGPDDSEIPTTISRGDAVAEGSFGAVVVQRLEVYSSGVEVVLRWIIRRDGLDSDQWAIRYRVLRWLSLDRDGRQIFPIAPPAPYVVRGNSMTSDVDDEIASGSTTLWVTPAPTHKDLVLLVPMPTILEQPGQIVLDAAVISRAIQSTRIIEAGTGTDASPDAPGSSS